MDPRSINVLISTLEGLNLPRTLNVTSLPTTSISDLLRSITFQFPALDRHISIATLGGKNIQEPNLPLQAFLELDGPNFVTFRLSAPLRGGKGGFGSQLRAAGGRMSSKRKKAQGENHGSNRNLDGRRLRTVNEAKALAEYLAVKPEMEKKEKEERRKRWQQVLDIAETKETNLRNGSKGRIDGSWLEEKEEASEKTRDAVVATMSSDSYRDNFHHYHGSAHNSSRDAVQNAITQDHTEHCSKSSPDVSEPRVGARAFAGFDDDDDEFMSDTDSQPGTAED